MIRTMIIAVDGAAASGKGTLSRRLSNHFDLAHLDTGSLYRALALQLLNTGKNADDIDESQIIKYSEKYLNIFNDIPYVFNLGHGLLPETDPDKVKKLIKFYREY